MRKINTRLRARRLAVAFTVVALGLVVAAAESSSSRGPSIRAKSAQSVFRMLASGASAHASAAAGAGTGVEITHGPRVAPGVFNGDVRDLPRTRPPERAFQEPGEVEPQLAKETLPGAGEPTPAAPAPASAPAPSPTVSFNGLGRVPWGAGYPPDTVGDVGPNHFVQAVNTSIGIFSKTGTQLAAFTFDTLWSGAAVLSGTACDADNQGDPTVIYDPLGDRWIVADFAFANVNSTPYYECIAVSKTSDPVSGGWYLHAIRTDDVSHPWFADYPKMGIWPDGLYMTANMFQGNTYREVRVWAFNRADLESGTAPRNVVMDLGTNVYASLLPSNLRTGAGIPPTGRENVLVAQSRTAFAFNVWKFHVDYSGGGSTFTGPTAVAQTTYPDAPATVATPGNSLDSLSDRLMMQAQYASIGGAESVWVNHTVGCCGGSAAGIQWAQLNVTGGTVAATPVQQQIYPAAGDGLQRWMGSLAVDRKGNMALGYSVANASTNPDIRYAGRLVGDPLGTLPQTETTMLDGVTRGSQTAICGGSTCIRWGDYSAMSLDPDGCRFWYTQEYYDTTGSNWQTRIGSFSFPACYKSSQAIGFGALPGKTFGDADFAVSASASSGLGVSFAAAGNCTVNGATVHITGAGSCKVTASQAGDSGYDAAADVAQTFAIAKANQTITFAAPANKTFGDTDFAVAATASSGLPVSFSAGGSCSVSGAGVHLTGPGTCTVTATQAGDANYNAAADVAQSFVVAKKAQTITFGALAGTAFGAASITLRATASSGLPVTFAARGKCTVAGTSVHIKGAGSCTVTASQAGDATYASAVDVARTFSIAKASQKITFRRLATKVFGTADFRVRARASSGLRVALRARGRCTIKGTKLHLTGAGLCTIIASQRGDANHRAAKSVVRSFKITPGPSRG